MGEAIQQLLRFSCRLFHNEGKRRCPVCMVQKLCSFVVESVGAVNQLLHSTLSQLLLPKTQKLQPTNLNAPTSDMPYLLAQNTNGLGLWHFHFTRVSQLSPSNPLSAKQIRSKFNTQNGTAVRQMHSSL